MQTLLYSVTNINRIKVKENKAMRTERIMNMNKLLHFFLAAERKEFLGRVTRRTDRLIHLKRKLLKFCFQGKQVHYQVSFIKGSSVHLLEIIHVIERLQPTVQKYRTPNINTEFFCSRTSRESMYNYSRQSDFWKGFNNM